MQTRPHLHPYSKREKLPESFVAAETYIAESNLLFMQADSLVEENNGDDVGKINTILSTIDKKLALVKSVSEHPYKRVKFLDNVYKNTDKYKKKTDASIIYIKKTYEGLVTYSDGYSVKYPKKKSQIDKFMSKIKAVYDSDLSMYSQFNKHYDLKKAKSDSFDLLLLANNYTNISKDEASLKKTNVSHRKKLAALNDSYTKILVDIDAKFYVQVGRSSWDGYSDYDDTKNVLFNFVQVDEATATYYDNLPENTVLYTHRGRKINATKWGSLKISNPKVNWPDRSHDEYEFWVNNTRIDYYHKYKIEKNGKVTETGWVKVSEDDFYDNLENVGMAIETKPIGVFEHEATDVATPPGMSYVNNPEYGQWKTNSNGDKFWEFYARWHMYNMMFGNHYYTYGMYTDYHTNYYARGRAYYGTGNRRYGTTGNIRGRGYSNTNYSRRFANNSRSSFNKNGVRSYTKSQASVRAGGSYRGGGPGGGGK